VDKVVLDPEDLEDQAVEQMEDKLTLAQMDSAAEAAEAVTDLEDHQEVTVLLY
jgi:hypothetical protein|tara:strand:+ start:221 stop:379 length:159 start_codon:yes stop_codon:yes gene_type:complete